MPALLTVGHGTAGQDELTELLQEAGVEEIVDVRRFPGSRRHPHVARDRLAEWLPAAGIGYRWEERLGGRRRPAPGSAHTGLRNTSFQAYADHMGTPAFLTAIGEVVEEARQRRVAVLCSESLWWRCHRRLLADHVALLTDLQVRHLLHDGRSAPHQSTDVVRVEDGSPPPAHGTSVTTVIRTVLGSRRSRAGRSSRWPEPAWRIAEDQGSWDAEGCDRSAPRTRRAWRGHRRDPRADQGSVDGRGGRP